MGLVEAIKTAFAVVRVGGTVSRVGAPQYAEVPMDFPVFLRNITLTVGLDQVADGYRATDGRTALKVIVQP